MQKWVFQHQDPQIKFPGFTFITNDPNQCVISSNISDEKDFDTKLEYDMRTHTQTLQIRKMKND